MASDQVWDLMSVSDEQRKIIWSLDSAGAVNIWNETRHAMDILVDGKHVPKVSQLLQENGIQYSVAIYDLQLASAKLGTAPVDSLMTWTAYHRLSTIHSFMYNLTELHPDLCTVHEIGKSVEGRPILVLRISNNRDENENVWIDGGIHAREWITPAVVTYIAARILENYEMHPSYISNMNWFFLPVMNPDGYEFSHTHDRMWRKSRSTYDKHPVGVDLNRNFSTGWGSDEGSSGDPGHVFYRGVHPFSEPETRAVRDFIFSSRKSFKVFLSLHSYGEVIIFPWGFKGDPCPDYVDLLAAGAAMAKGIRDCSDRTYKVGSTKDLMYYAAGTSIDWSYGEANIPYSFMLELRDKTHMFLLPTKYIIPTCEEVFSGIERFMEYVDDEGTGTHLAHDSE